MARPRVPPPPLDIPASQSTVEVYIIDTTSFMSGFPASSFVEPLVPGFDTMDGGSYAYLIRHPGAGPAPSGIPDKYKTLVFDLGVRRDWENSPEPFVRGIKEAGFGIRVDADVAGILRGHGQDPAGVGAIIWSHWHFDHSGDPRTFPPTTDLVVGPGFREAIMPGYPTDPASHVDQRAWEGRELHEVDFGSGAVGAAGRGAALRIGGFRAVDLYGDGSFYLLSSPGHAVGHMSALARTTAAGAQPSFLLLGGDIAHHCGEFRPTPYVPLPDVIPPCGLPGRGAGCCPGRIFAAVHPSPGNKWDAPFFDPVRGDGWHHDAVEAKASIDLLAALDAHDTIFPVMAHDMSLRGTVDLFPLPANAWMAKGWKERTRWGFLASFTPAEDDGGGDGDRPQPRI